MKVCLLAVVCVCVCVWLLCRNGGGRAVVDMVMCGGVVTVSLWNDYVSWLMSVVPGVCVCGGGGCGVVVFGWWICHGRVVVTLWWCGGMVV